jgi:hypothetical protein
MHNHWSNIRLPIFDAPRRRAPYCSVAGSQDSPTPRIHLRGPTPILQPTNSLPTNTLPTAPFLLTMLLSFMINWLHTLGTNSCVLLLLLQCAAAEVAAAAAAPPHPQNGKCCCKSSSCPSLLLLPAACCLLLLVPAAAAASTDSLWMLPQHVTPPAQ